MTTDQTDQTTEQPIEPTDAPDQPEPGRTVTLRTENGVLSIRPDQKALDANQVAALVAIGIDVKNDPGVEPHIRPFMHMCQRKGLDPWVREAYLIGRGSGNSRKWTMQTGIDGYRKIANRTGRFIRVKETVWTGQDDDDRSYVAVDDGKGGVVMRRVWYDQWPASRGYPGAARVTIEHYDDRGQVAETEAVADWGMYAPFTKKWTWGERRGERVDVLDDEGNPVMVLNDMWEKGYAHMLAKCAEALAHRKAFQAEMSGVYTHEEMHRADQIERDRQAAVQAEARRAAYLQASTGTSAPDAEVPTPEGPVRAGVVLPEVVPDSPQSTAPSDAPEPDPEPDRPQASPEQQVAWLHEELALQADVLGHPVATVANRAVKVYRKNVEDFTEEELRTLVASLRPHVGPKMSDVATGTRYAGLAPTVYVGDVRRLLGLSTDEADVVDAEEVDPESEHPYRDDGDGLCRACGLPEDVGPHPE